MQISSIKVARDVRQRTKLTNLDDLAESMKRVGLINPIIVRTDETGTWLVAGERRLEAAKLLGWEEIPARELVSLTKDQQDIVELDENIRREELPWKDRCVAILKLHEKLGGTLENTAEYIGLNKHWVSENIVVAREVIKENPAVTGASGVSAAMNVISRSMDRAISSELENLGEVFEEPDMFVEPVGNTQGALASDSPTVSKTPAAYRRESPVKVGDFLEFAPSYDGRPFNLLHCDFPYGINHDKSDQGKADSWGGYKDTPEHYRNLCHALTDNLDRLLTREAHVVFWFSMDFYSWTVQHFKAAGMVVQPHPLIWHKTDNHGILPDPNRGPRRIYETALLMTRGDRKIVKAVSNVYGCPTSKLHHLSEKPVTMLDHFFRMLVDEFTELLDPTCGSGNALIAAERLGATRTFGLEFNPEFAEVAQHNVQTARTRRELEK